MNTVFRKGEVLYFYGTLGLVSLKWQKLEFRIQLPRVQKQHGSQLHSQSHDFEEHADSYNIDIMYAVSP